MIDPILVELEGGSYVGMILPGTLAHILVIRRPAGSSGSGGRSSSGGNGVGIKFQKGWRLGGGREGEGAL